MKTKMMLKAGLVTIATLIVLAALLAAPGLSHAAPVANDDNYTTNEDTALMVGTAGNWYVAPNGSSSNPGTIEAPWDIESALVNTTDVQSGDTIWIKGGTYYYPNQTPGANRTGTYLLDLRGTPEAPITIRAYPGERVTIDGGLWLDYARHIRVQDIEFIISENFTRSRGTNVPSSGGAPADRPIGGIDIHGDTDIKFINNVVHANTSCGFGLWRHVSGDSELYGNLIYDNGWIGPDRYHGHGIYTQNTSPDWKYIEDNISFDNYCLPGKFYGQASWIKIDRYVLRGNAFYYQDFASGGDCFIIGAWNDRADQIHVLDNMHYGADLDIMYMGADDIAISGNTFFKAMPTGLEKCTNLTLENNFIWGEGDPIPGVTETPKVFLRPNKYDSKRANLTIMAFRGETTADVNVSSFLNPEETYRVMRPNDFYGSPVSAGTCAGDTITVPVPNEFTSYVILKHNGLPIAFSDGLAITELGVPIEIDILANDQSFASSINSSSVDLVKSPNHGTVNVDTPTAGQITYTPEAGFFGTDFFSYRVEDNNGIYSNEAMVMIHVTNGETTTPAINFNNYEIKSYGGYFMDGGVVSYDEIGPPSIDPEDVTTLRLVGNGWKTIDMPYYVMENTVLDFYFTSTQEGEMHAIGLDTDSIGLNLARTFKVYGTADHMGRFRASNFDYDDYPNTTHYVIPVGQYYTGLMKYLFFANAHYVSSPTAESVFSNIRIYEDEDNPITPPEANYSIFPECIPGADGYSYSTPVISGGVLDNDTYTGQVENVTLVSDVSDGNLDLNAANGSFTYTPPMDENYSGEVSFTYTVTDSEGESNPATVIIRINSINDRPNADDDGYTTGKDTPLLVNEAGGLLANDTDINQDTLTAKLADGPSDYITTAEDSSDNEGHGEFKYNTWETHSGPQWIAGIINGALAFDGIDDFVEIPLDGTSLEEFSASVWFKTSESGLSEGATTIIQWAAANVYGGYAFFSLCQEDDMLKFQTDKHGSHNNYVIPDSNSPFTLNSDTWYHAVITLNASNIWSVYINGASIGTYEDVDGVHRHQDTATKIFLGKGYLGAFTGLIDETRIYNRVLSASEISALATASTVGDPGSLSGGLLGQWNLDAPKGLVELNPNGSFRYTPFPGFTGDITFSYRANDGMALSDAATATISIQEGGHVITPGDVTGEGDVTIKDAILVARYAAGVITGWDEDTLQAANVNNSTGDGRDNITMADAILIAQYVVGAIEEF